MKIVETSADDQNIQIIKLAEETELNFIVKHISDEEGRKSLSDLPVHRDDSYLFLLLESGAGHMEVDFHTIEMNGPELCIIRPGQVHYNICSQKADVWVVKFDASIVPPEFIRDFDEKIFQKQHFQLDKQQSSDMSTTLRMLHKHIDGSNKIPLWQQIASALLGLFICQSVSVVLQNNPRESGGKQSRQKNLCRRFKQLLMKEGIALKAPAQVAEKLHLSESYINEVIKRHTGFNVCYWLRENLMLEARRQLCFTDKTVKEIAFAVGFEDYSYFSKAFKQHVGMTPGAFRAKYRE